MNYFLPHLEDSLFALMFSFAIMSCFSGFYSDAISRIAEQVFLEGTKYAVLMYSIVKLLT